MNGGRLVALGGGGFSMEPDNPRLDRFVLSLARRPRPRVLFVGTASGDSAEYRLRFYEAFSRLPCRPAHLELCWFERMVTDSVPGGGIADGLGFAGGCFCPHFDSEPWRRPFVERLAAAQPATGGFACDDGAAVVLDGRGDFIEAVCSVPGRTAHRWAGGRLEALATRLLERPAATEPPLLRGSRCTLRTLTPADAPSIRRHADDEAVWRNLFDGFPRPYTAADAEAWCGGEWRQPRYGWVWAIDAGGEAIGCISVAPQQGWLRCSAAVGYWIGRAHWRRGITSEALALVTAWAWRGLPEVTRLFAPVFARNLASQRVAARCGYVKEAELPMSAMKDGEVIDLVQYACYRRGAATIGA